MTLELLDSVASMPPQPTGQAPSGLSNASRQGVSLEASADDLALVRRELRIGLLRDLVSNGLYQVSTEALADRLLGVLTPPT